jgi:hypothetical protein
VAISRGKITALSDLFLSLEAWRLLLVLFPIVFVKSLACSCMGYEIDAAYKEYDVVFIGKTQKIEGIFNEWTLDIDEPLEDGYELLPSSIIVYFTASKIFKGIDKKEVFIETSNFMSDCGYPFRDGIEYVVFAYWGLNQEVLYVDTCSPTIHTQKQDVRYENERKRVLDFLNNKTE